MWDAQVRADKKWVSIFLMLLLLLLLEVCCAAEFFLVCLSCLLARTDNSIRSNFALGVWWWTIKCTLHVRWRSKKKKKVGDEISTIVIYIYRAGWFVLTGHPLRLQRGAQRRYKKGHYFLFVHGRQQLHASPKLCTIATKVLIHQGATPMCPATHIQEEEVVEESSLWRRSGREARVLTTYDP